MTVMVDATAIGETGNVIVEDDRDLDALSAWARAAKAHGARVFMQINHPGRQSPRSLPAAGRSDFSPPPWHAATTSNTHA